MDGLDEAGREARRGSMLKLRVAGIDQQDTAMTSAGGAFDKAAQDFENLRKRTTQGHHLEQPSLPFEESLGPFPVVDCAEELVLQSGPFWSLFLKSELGGLAG